MNALTVSDSDEFLLVSEGKSVRGIAIGESQSEAMVPAVSHGQSLFFGLDFDYQERVVFFTEFVMESVSKSLIEIWIFSLVESYLWKNHNQPVLGMDERSLHVKTFCHL